MFDFDALSNAMVHQTVLCVGDLMPDEFVYGEVSRISPEAPAPVIAVERSETNIGGAGNVARNVASLGARCIFVGLIWEDEAGAKLKAALSQQSQIESVLVCDPARPTTRKVRFVSEHFSTHMLRADWELAQPAAAQDAMQLADCEAMLVTHGMMLVPRNGEAIHVPAHPVKVREVSGAGDTVVAALAVGADWETALRMANAAVAVGKKGTASVTSAELRRKILPHAFLAAEEKIIAAGGDLHAHLRDWRQQGLRIGFTNGCFDILHPGHVKVLTAARGACDRLIVGLNSDASVKRLKGEGRPVQDEHARSEVLAALEAVDLVVIFEEDTPISLITQIRPSVLVKGGDYTRDQVVGHEIVEAAGGEVLLVEVLPGFSTTSLVNRARGGKA